MRPFSIHLILSLFFMACFSGQLLADSPAAATERIKDRLAQIDQMKTAGDVGENANGYLEPRGQLGPRQASLVEAENTDRRILYTAVADKTGQTVAEVGQQRALRIAELARSGVWLQKPAGNWYQKP